MPGNVMHPVQFKATYESRFGSARVSPSGYVSNMFVRDEERGKGHGTELMGQITSDADKFRHGLTMHARPELHEWYAKHGFVQTGHDYIGGTATPRLERKPKDIEGI